MYSVEFTKSSKKFLNKIQKQDAEVIVNKIYSIRDNPFRYLKRLKGHKLWRLRIMKYRVEMDVIISKNKIIVVRVGYRKNIYK